MPGPMSGTRATVIRPDADHRILTITDSLGQPIVTTAAPHGLAPDLEFTVLIVGTSNPDYNGTFPAVVMSPNTFDIGIAYTADSTGGTWSRA